MFRDALIYLFLQVTFIQKPTYVDDMFVHPSYRGQKIATTLFHKMERRAKKLGATRIDLMVWEFNESAQELYRSLGMTPQRYILEKLL